MSQVFTASRWTRGNRLFPTVIEVGDEAVTRRKRSGLRTSETTMHLSRVASVGVEAGLLFADVRIESSGGGEDIISHGHWKRDARRIQALIEDWQTRHLAREPDPGGEA